MLRRQKRQSGFTLIEVLIASVVLVFGLLAVLGLFATAVGNNGRSRADSTSTMLAQSVIEQIAAVLAHGGPQQITDCLGHTFAVDSAAGGARLGGSSIDFSESAPPAGYWTNNGSNRGYTVCDGGGGESGTHATYDVRWNITSLTCGTQQQCTYVITVAARPISMTPGRFTFALPITLRAYVGSEP